MEIKIFYIYAASYVHESPDEVIGVGVVLLRGELGGVELSGSQDLQHAVQGLGYGHWAALLGRIDDVYYLGVKENKRVSLNCMPAHADTPQTPPQEKCSKTFVSLEHKHVT